MPHTVSWEQHGWQSLMSSAIYTSVLHNVLDVNIKGNIFASCLIQACWFNVHENNGVGQMEANAKEYVTCCSKSIEDRELGVRNTWATIGSVSTADFPRFPLLVFRTRHPSMVWPSDSATCTKYIVTIKTLQMMNQGYKFVLSVQDACFKHSTKSQFHTLSVLHVLKNNQLTSKTIIMKVDSVELNVTSIR